MELQSIMRHLPPAVDTSAFVMYCSNLCIAAISTQRTVNQLVLDECECCQLKAAYVRS